MEKIKLVVITGFLGSGKTTLLNRLIELCAGTKAGVIVNEFGKISIDGQLVQGNAGEISEINNGSIFCSCLQGSFVDALIRFSALPIEYLFVESSGMADPSNLGTLLDMVQKRTNGRYLFDRNICVVDGRRLPSLMPVLPVLEKQLRYSHVILANKLDLMSQVDQDSLLELLDTINPNAQVLKTTDCQVPDDFLSATLASQELPEPESSLNTISTRPKTIILRTKEPCSKEKLIEFLSSISPSVYRAKGFVKCFEGWRLVNVTGDQIDVQPCDHQGDASTLVFISCIGPAIIREVSQQWNALMGISMILGQ